ncbi:MAG: AI-2E family transporter [Candidatus Carbobacillus altaicus]|nr:AI-2E family transporter [Candidatus Carbobacillus altaicus]
MSERLRQITMGVTVILLWLALWHWVREPVIGTLKFFGRLLMPFWIALIIAYMLLPLIKRLERLGLKRSHALLLVYSVFLIGGALGVYWSTPYIVSQFQLFQRALPEVFQELESGLDRLQNHFDGWPEVFRDGVHQTLENGGKKISEAMTHILTLSDDAFEWLMTLSLSPFIVYYILKDSSGFLTELTTFFPKKEKKRILHLFRDMDEDISDYVSAQLIISFILGVLTFIGYLLIGFPYAFVFAVLSMFTNLIPFIGPFLGAMPALVVAFTVSWKMVLGTLVVNAVAQFVENNLLSPFVTGKSTDMHPLLVIFVVMVGGEAAGVLGMIFAVPVAVMVRRALTHIASYVHEVRHLSSLPEGKPH